MNENAGLCGFVPLFGCEYRKRAKERLYVVSGSSMFLRGCMFGTGRALFFGRMRPAG